MTAAVHSFGACIALCVLAWAAPSFAASGLAEYGNELLPGEPAGVKLHGYLRTRAEAFWNLDLDRGPTPSGQTFFPEPLSNPSSPLLTMADGRLRTDLVAQGPGGNVAAVVRIDWIDNLPFGGSPELTPGFGVAPTPAASLGQTPVSLFHLRYGYGVASTPLGIVTAGRMGAAWGLGMLANGGDCADCNNGDAADRIAFVTSIANLYWAVAYDFSAIGPFVPRKDQKRSIDLDPTDDVRTFTLAVFQTRDENTRRRRGNAGKWTVDYGATLSHRRQDNDVPASYLPTETPVTLDASQVIRRNFRSTLVDGWLRIWSPSFRIELEGALDVSSVEQASLIPGALFNQPVTSMQWGGALESDFGGSESSFHGGVDVGVASGDSAPGFGAYPRSGVSATRGELDAPQALPPSDTTVNNFRFSPDYRVDQILFHELIGTVTDAAYLKPWASYRLLDLSTSQLTLKLAAIGSSALYASSTPSGQAPLGVELDSSLLYASNDGFSSALEHAVLFPLAGLDNPDLGLRAQPAQLLRLRISYAF
ncbi:MAG: TIGR04551 family protein [Myxococcaceae bacterium]